MNTAQPQLLIEKKSILVIRSNMKKIEMFAVGHWVSFILTDLGVCYLTRPIWGTLCVMPDEFEVHYALHVCPTDFQFNIDWSRSFSEIQSKRIRISVAQRRWDEFQRLREAELWVVWFNKCHGHEKVSCAQFPVRSKPLELLSFATKSTWSTFCQWISFSLSFLLAIGQPSCVHNLSARCEFCDRSLTSITAIRMKA